jgi:hypothetical protein
MARPKPQIEYSVTLGSGQVWDVLQAEATYVITYKGKPCGIRTWQVLEGPHAFKYKKTSYANLGNALAQVRVLNHRFDCKDFDIQTVC